MTDFSESVDVGPVTYFDSRGESRAKKRYFPLQEPDVDGYTLWTVHLRVPDNTVNLLMHAHLLLRMDTDKSWARTEAYLQIDEGPKKMRFALELKRWGDNIPVTFDDEPYHNYYNGQRVKFIVRHRNEVTTIKNIPRDDIYIDQIA